MRLPGQAAPARLAVSMWLVGDVRREVKAPTGGELTLFQAVGRWD
jgi:hypothetical protein